jgi:hypothetical protein
MSSFKKEKLSACKASLARERRNLKLLKRFANSPEATSQAKVVLGQMVWVSGLKIKNGKKFIKRYATA